MRDIKSEEIQSRREFFKRSIKTILPIFGIALFGTKSVLAKTEYNSSKKTNAPMDCYGSCYGTCYGTCLSCTGTCTSCYGTCTSCYGTCTSCYGTCIGTCFGGCWWLVYY